MLPLVGCYSADNEKSIKSSACKEVPADEYNSYIQAKSKILQMSRDSAAITLKADMIREHKTCHQVIEEDGACAAILFILLGGAIGGN